MTVSPVRAKHFKELVIWQKAMELVKAVYILTAKFPSEEKFGLIAQMRRAAVSIPSNIAEGQARRGTREFLNFLSHASGSAAELETQLLLSVNLGHCSRSETERAGSLLTEVQKMSAAIRLGLERNLASH